MENFQIDTPQRREQKRQKSTSFCFLFAALDEKCLLFREKALVFFSRSLSSRVLKKKWPKLAPERFLPHKTLQNDQLYLYYSSRTTNNTITTHHHFRGAQTHTRLFLAALSLSLALFERERALAFISSLSFSKSEIHHLFPLACG